jgi:hypothetical protein
MVLPFFPVELIELVAGPERAKNLAGKYPPPDSDPFFFNDGRVRVVGLWDLSRTSGHRRETRLFLESHRLFIRSHNETLSIAAMRVNNSDRSPVKSNR